MKIVRERWVEEDARQIEQMSKTIGRIGVQCMKARDELIQQASLHKYSCVSETRVSVKQTFFPPSF